jgi:hypothetical protein
MIRIRLGVIFRMKTMNKDQRIENVLIGVIPEQNCSEPCFAETRDGREVILVPRATHNERRRWTERLCDEHPFWEKTKSTMRFLVP